MRRVLLLVTDLECGGTPMRVVRWARWLRQHYFKEFAAPALALKDPLFRPVTIRSRDERVQLLPLAELLEPGVLKSFAFVHAAACVTP